MGTDHLAEMLDTYLLEGKGADFGVTGTDPEGTSQIYPNNTPLQKSKKGDSFIL